MTGRSGVVIGGIGRKLGFRWIFPIGTMPIPYHPLIGLAFSFGPVLWVAWLAMAAVMSHDGALTWWQPLLAALLLAIPMSIPIVAWAMMAFRAPIAQGLLIAGSMTLLAIDVATGRAAPWWAALPAGFVLLYTVQRVGGKAKLATLQAAAETWLPIDPGDATVIVPGEVHTASKARLLIAAADIARVLSLPGPPLKRQRPAQTVMLHWLTEGGIARLRAACNDVGPAGWHLPREDAAPVLQRPAEDDRVHGLTATIARYRSLLAGGRLYRLSVSGVGDERAVVWGSAQIVARLPVFTFFHWTAFLGGKSEWHIGFVPERAIQLGPEWSNEHHMLPKLFSARAEDGGRNDDVTLFGSDKSGGLLAVGLAAAAASERERVAAFWRSIAEAPLEPVDGNVLQRLRDANGLFRPGDGMRLVTWLKAAREGRKLYAVRHAAMMIEALPNDEFVATGPALFDVVNSRVLAGEWDIGPELDLKSVPKDCPRFGKVGGYGLALHHPRLYKRYAQLGPKEAALVKSLADSLDGHHFLS
ncbi:MAG: hypothetical protein Q7T60_11625 [Sphingopyxis sp.]|nr:hypothetical protein [Sphingopyxis sp.]